MLLSEQQLSSYLNNGLLMVDQLLSHDEVELLRNEIQLLSQKPLDSHLYEGHSYTMRALHGCDQQSDVMNKLVRLSRLLLPVEQMLDEQVYLHQFKVSIKSAFEGDVWRWHQDHAFWHYNDALPESKAITAAIFLDKVTEFNAPIYLIPGTKNEPLQPCKTFIKDAQLPNGSPEWHENVIADFKYTMRSEEVKRLIKKNGIISAKGDAGSVLFFHSSVPHASTWNISPWDRIAIFISYNVISNRPVTVQVRRDEQRPLFLAASSFDALTPLDEII